MTNYASRPPKVASLIHTLDGSSFARVYSPLDYLARSGRVQLLGRWDVFDADFVIFHRHWREDSLEVMKELQRQGIRCLLDYDDDVYNIEPQNPAYKEYSNPELRKSIYATLAQADMILASTENLREKLLSITSRVMVVPNCLDFEQTWNYSLNRESNGSVFVLGWAGSVSHAGDFSFLRGQFRKLHRKYGDRIHFKFLGHLPDFLRQTLPESAYSFQPFVPVNRYPDALRKLNLDLALLPIKDNEFNRAKSNLKYLEFSAVGTPCLASNVGPYREAGPLWRLSNRGRDWGDLISELLESDRKSLRNAARSAYYEVRAGFSMERQTAALLEGFDRASREVRIRDLPAPPVPRPLPKVTVVVPVYNAREDTQRCIGALIPQLDDDVNLLVVNDCSSDAELNAWLLQKGQDHGFHQLLPLENGGFVKSCNLGMDWALERGRDVVLLNSDTVPSRDFARKLRDTAYSDARIGTVTAVTNNGTIASVPELRDVAEIPPRPDWGPIQVPTAVGHCMYIKQEVLRKYGQFDEVFGRGYGEENDFSLRIRGEYRNVMDPKVYVWHRGRASFGEQGSSRISQNLQIVRQRYPGYDFEVHCFQHTNPLISVRKDMLRRSRDSRPRVLHVAHSYFQTAGTERHVHDLCRLLKDDFLGFIAYPNQNGSLMLVHDDLIYSGKIYPQAAWPIAPLTVPRMDEVWDEIVEQSQPDLIHVHHLLNHPLGLLEKLYRYGKPVLVTLHDAYVLCPDFHLVGCPGTDQCESCFVRHFNGQGHPDYQQSRRNLFRKQLAEAAAIVSPSRFMLREVERTLHLQYAQAQVIPHGVARPDRLPEPATLDRSGPLKFVLLGNLIPKKGGPVILHAVVRLAEKYPDVEFHVHGVLRLKNPERLPKGIVLHGPYHHDRMPDLTGYHCGIVPSQFPESFCYTLTEMQAQGLPVLASHIGAIPERIVQGSSGWTVDDYGSPQAWQKELTSLIEDRSWQGAVYPLEHDVRSLRDMIAEYRGLYLSLLEARLTATELRAA